MRTGRFKLRIEHNGKFSLLASGLRFIYYESTTMPSADFCSITSNITTGSAPTTGGRKVEQISTGKNMILPCTTAAFTIPHVLQAGFVMLCPLTQGFGLVCDFCSSARRFALRLLPDGRSPFRPCLRLVLFKGDTLSPFWNMYRGLTPHKIMPMPGTHKPINSDGKNVCGLSGYFFGPLVMGNVRAACSGAIESASSKA